MKFQIVDSSLNDWVHHGNICRTTGLLCCTGFRVWVFCFSVGVWYVARRLSAADLASWEVWEVCLHCLVFWMVTGGRRLYSLHVRLMWANGRKQEGSFIFSVFEWCSNGQRHAVEVKELYNTLKKTSISISAAVTLPFFLSTLFFFHNDFAANVCIRYILALYSVWNAVCLCTWYSVFNAIVISHLSHCKCSLLLNQIHLGPHCDSVGWIRNFLWVHS